MLFRKRADSKVDTTTSVERFVWLADFMALLSESLLGATALLKGQHIEAVAEFYDEIPTSSSEGTKSVLTPKTLSMAIPAFHAAPDQTAEPVAVPIAALAQHNPLVLEEAVFDIECMIAGVREARSGAGPDGLGLHLERSGPGAPTRLTIKLKRVDAPEGLSRIDDALNRKLQ